MATVAELIMEQGRRRAEDRLRRGDTSARMWTSLADILGSSVNRYAQEQQDAPVRAQQQELRDLQLNEARAGAAAREQATAKEAGFQQTMQRGGGRDAILKSLEGDPELYKRASEHFDRIDAGYKRLMGDVAAGVRAFGDTPEAALIAIDDLISKGFDERQMEQYRKAIQENPQAVGQLIDGLLANSPEDAHQKMVMPKAKPEGPVKLGPGDVLYDPNTREQITSVPQAPKLREVVVKGPGGRPIKKLVSEDELMQGVEQYEAPRAVQAAEPLHSIIGEDGQPVLVPRSQAVGRRPASNREQGRPVTSGDAGRLAELDTALDDLKVLDTTLTETKGSTGVDAKIGAALPNFITEWTGAGTDAKKRQGVIDRVKQVIGKALEGGVLRKEDEKKYEKILPTIGDPNDVAISKLEGLASAVQQRRSRLVDALEDAGYDVSAYRERAAVVPQSGVALTADKVWDPVSKTFKPGGGR